MEVHCRRVLDKLLFSLILQPLRGFGRYLLKASLFISSYYPAETECWVISPCLKLGTEVLLEGVYLRNLRPEKIQLNQLGLKSQIIQISRRAQYRETNETD